MPTQDFNRAMEIFEKACDLPAASRAAFIEQACAGDAALQAEVESLLEHDRTGSAFDAMADGGMVGALAGSLGADQEGGALDRLGPYRILRKIGEGGMGEVYEAEQESPRRRVALKIIRSGQLSPKLVRRFENEAYVLGKLQHPGIAHIYESGMVRHEGRDQPFFAMEFIDGVRITSYADERRLGLRQRLALFAHVCDAVQHAHQKGVIHRDLKPGNILVVDRESPSTTGGTDYRSSTEFDGVGQPKVLDFGVARVTDGDMQAVTAQTDLGQLIGTLAYMSPEQVAGDSSKLDTRCDIYALGVVLYQLLTNRLPLDVAGQSIAEAARMIRDDDPTPVSVIDRTLRGDVETILIKALDKDPTRRFATAAELAADLRRFLRDEPIAARPASAIYNMRKFARRNRGLVGGLVATFLVLLIGATGTTIGLLSALRANNELAKTNQVLEQTNADLERVSAFQSTQLTGIDVPGLGQHIRADLLDSIEESERVAIESGLANVNYTDLARSALDGFIFDRTINTVRDEFSEQPVLRARLLQDLSTVLRRLGILDQAVDPQSHALQIRRQELGADHPDTLASMEESGYLHQELGDYGRAESFYNEAWQVSRRLHGDDDLRTLAAQSNMATIQYLKGELASALDSANAVLAGYDALGSPDEELATMSVLGAIHVELSQYDEAEQVQRETLKRRRAIFGDDHHSTQQSIANLAELLSKIGKYEEAQKLSEEALAIRQRLSGNDHPDTADSLAQLGDVLSTRGKLNEAEPLLRDAVATHRRLPNATPTTTKARVG
ncbi:MAG: tetratricopeptide repeat protein, partial [Phycisphaerae bacterium]